MDQFVVRDDDECIHCLAKLGEALLGIGSSFAPTQVNVQRTTQLNSPNWTDYDNAYLLNHAVWDQYFLSSAAPEMTKASAPADPIPSDPTANPNANANSNGNGNGNGNTGPVETRSLSQVLDDFVNGVQPLNNPRMRLLGEFHGGADLRAATAAASEAGVSASR